MLKKMGVAEILDPARNVAVNEEVSERAKLDELQGWGCLFSFSSAMVGLLVGNSSNAFLNC